MIVAIARGRKKNLLDFFFRRNVGLFTVPNQIACLSQLSVLDLSYNRLETVPCPIFELKELKHLDLSHNRIIHLPTTLGNNFSKLTFLDLSTNPLEEIPVSLAQLARLTWLDLSHTAIDALPAELLRLRQTTIKCDHCPALEKRLESFEHSLVNDVPSLAEFCCRQLVILQATTSRPVKRKKRSIFRRRSPPTPGPSFLPLHEYRLPSGLGRYLAIQPQPCSFCGRPYFENPVIRYRLVQRNDETWVPVKYQLCSAHWGSETDRILAFFATGSNYRNDSWLASVSAKPE